MKTKIILLLIVGFATLGINSQAQTASKWAGQTETLFKSLKTGDYELMRPLLDPQVKIGDLPQGFNDMVVPQVITQLPKPDSYTFVSEKKEGKNTRVTIEVLLEGQKESRSFVFSPDGKVIELDILGKAKAEAKFGSMED